MGDLAATAQNNPRKVCFKHIKGRTVSAVRKWRVLADIRNYPASHQERVRAWSYSPWFTAYGAMRFVVCLTGSSDAHPTLDAGLVVFLRHPGPHDQGRRRRSR